MKNNFDQARNLIQSANHILFTTHERTDGDDLGTVLALAQYCRQMGKTVSIVITGGVPHQLAFLPMSNEVLESLPTNPADLLIVSGCSTITRIGNERMENLNVPIINFDHHPDNTNFGKVNVVDATKSSVAELMYDFFQYCAWEINFDIARCLLTGIITDTGAFMHSNTKESTLKAASVLMSKGVATSSITKHTQAGKDIQTMRAWGRALMNIHFDRDSGMICSAITEQDMNELGNPPSSAFEGVVETLNKVPEAKYAMLLKQDGDRIKGSLRSEQYKDTDVQSIAKQFGGGGHKLAAGFAIEGKITKEDNGKWQII